jgi:hypothetical protein
MNGGSAAIVFLIAIGFAVTFVRLVACFWWKPTFARKVAGDFIFIFVAWFVVIAIAEGVISPWFSLKVGSQPGYAYFVLAISLSVLTLRQSSARLEYFAPENFRTPSDINVLRRKFILFFAVILVTAASFYFLCLRPISFERIKWDRYQSNWLDLMSTRHRMADNLLSSKALLGKSRDEIVGMLGEPPSTGYFSKWDLVYQLGAERGYFSIDSEWLLIRLDAQGRAIEAKLARD